MKIAILGAGVFGTALGGILADKGYDLDYYDIRLEPERLGDVLDKAGVVILCVPSQAAPHLLPHIDKKIPLIVATKGILTDQIFRDFSDWEVLSGPGFADDIKARRQVTFTVTGERARELFATDYVKFDQTHDRKGVLMCGALKNVYAILAGYRGLERKTTAWQTYITAAKQEMALLLEANGADPLTTKLACGAGDLALTCGEPSRNFIYGMKLKSKPGYQPVDTVEGLAAIRRIRRHEITVPHEAEILREIIELVSSNTKAASDDTPNHTTSDKPGLGTREGEVRGAK